MNRYDWSHGTKFQTVSFAFVHSLSLSKKNGIAVMPWVSSLQVNFQSVGLG